MIYATESVTGRRERNEDSFGVKEFENFLVALVADGMGGHAAGEVASQNVVSALLDELSEYQLNDNPKKALEQAIHESNLSVYRLANDMPEYGGMGSTVVCAVVYENRYTIANVGDSRIYLISDNSISQLTKDHSLVGELLESGSITKEQAKNHPLRNMITKSMGNASVVHPDISTGKLKKNDMLLLCSDGLHSSVSDETIFSICSESTSLSAICHKLVDTALSAGSKDNITVVIVRNGEE